MIQQPWDPAHPLLARFGLAGERVDRQLRLAPEGFRLHELIALELTFAEEETVLAAELLISPALATHPLESCWADQIVRALGQACLPGHDLSLETVRGPLPYQQEFAGLRVACRELPGALGLVLCSSHLKPCPTCLTPLWQDPLRCSRCGQEAGRGTWLKRLFG